MKIRVAFGASLAFVLASAVPPSSAWAEPPSATASDADAAAAIGKFKEDFKGKGLKGSERISQKEFALRTLSKVVHPTVVEALAAASRDVDPTVRMIAVIYLGEQKPAVGALAGAKVVEALRKAASDDNLRMTCLEAVGRLKYLGAREEIRDALKAQSFAVKKAALLAAARTADVRLLREVLGVVGVDVPADGTSGAGGDDSKSGGKEVVQEGYSWEGGDASVDTGSSGDGDQKAAEAQARAEAAANEAAARANAGANGGGGGSPSGDGGAGGRGGASRSSSELLPQVLAAIRAFTGQSFKGPVAFKKWFHENRDAMTEKARSFDEKEKEQKDQAKGQKGAK